MNDEIVIGGDSVDIPPGVYPASVDTIVNEHSEAYGDYRRWTFKLDNGSSVQANTSMYTSSKSKGGKWIAALLGRKPEKGERVTLAGRACTVVVGLNANDWPTVTDVLPTQPQPVVKATPAGTIYVEQDIAEGVGVVAERQEDTAGNLPF